MRAELLRRTRAFFDDRGFIEVETPLLSADTVIDRHLDPLASVMPDDPRQPDRGRRFWLQTSPEFAMKRLMAAGGEAIFQITRAFRAAETGRLHNSEFTIVEWYRKGDSMTDGMDLLSELAVELLDTRPAERIRYRDAFLLATNIDPLVSQVVDFRRAAKAHQLTVPDGFGDDRDNWLDYLMSELVSPNLGRNRPAIVYDFPASQAMLAKLRPENPPVAERFELFFRGIELANGYHELLDANELRQRNELTNAKRVADGRTPLPAESRLLAAMESGLPSCTGLALGFDRVVMLAAGASSLEEVVAFPIDRA